MSEDVTRVDGPETDDLSPTDPNTRVTVFQFGVRRVPTGLKRPNGRMQSAYPVLPEAGHEQLYLANQFYNGLIEIEKNNELEIQRIWGTVPELAQVNADLEAALARVTELAEKIKSQTKTRGGKAGVDVGLDVELKHAKVTMKEMKVKQRETKNNVYAAVEPLMAELRLVRKEQTKALRQEFAARGLYWGTYNDILAHHRVAVANIGTKRRNGMPAEHHFHRFTGDGVLTVQLQRSTGDMARVPELLATDMGPWRNVFQLQPWIDPDDWEKMTRSQRKRAGAGQVTMRLSGEEKAVLPVRISRPLPAEADVTGVQIVRRQHADKHTLSVAVTAKVPRVPPKETGPAIALHLGWRVRHDSSLRVATWVSTEPLVVPEHLREYVTSYVTTNSSQAPDGHTWGEVIFPNAWREDFKYVDDLRSRRDKRLEDIKKIVSVFLNTGRRFSDFPDLTAADVAKWQSQAPMAVLAKKVRAGSWDRTADAEACLPEDYRTVEEALISWYRWDKRNWQRETGTRRRVIRRRTDVYRRISAWLAKSARVLVVDNVVLSALAKSTTAADPATDRARANRVLAAPGDLRQYAENATVTHGAHLKRQAADSSKYTHFVCGTETVQAKEFILQASVACPECGRNFDQDENMGYLLLKAAGEIN